MPSTTRLHRRSAVALAATFPLAGCSGLLGNEPLVDDSLSFGERGLFEAAAGDELEVTVETESDQPATVQIVGMETGYSGPIFATAVDDEETTTVPVETDDEYAVAVTSGTARVTVESV